jgi:hypothetical protein
MICNIFVVFAALTENADGRLLPGDSPIAKKISAKGAFDL